MVSGIGLDLRNHDALGPARDACHQREMSRQPAHDLDQERAVQRSGSDPQAVDGLQRYVDCRRSTDRDVRAAQIVVDRGCHTDHGCSAPLQLPGSRLRTISADDDQRRDPVRLQLPERSGATLSVLRSSQRVVPSIVPPR